MNIIEVLKHIVNHPLNKDQKLYGLFKFVNWQLHCRLVRNKLIKVKFGENSIVYGKKGLTGITGNFYCGLHEFYDMAFLLHFLREEDLFLDVGANVGSYSILSASEVGAETISFEPILQTFQLLQSNLKLNGVENRCKMYNIGIGAIESRLKFTSNFDTMNHIVTDKETENAVSIAVKPLDEITTIDRTTLIKIDVEGFETDVLKGMPQMLENPNCKAIIIELNGSGNRFGYNEKDIHENLLSNGLKPYTYDPFNRQLTEQASFGNHNTIYIRDFKFVDLRVKSAKKFHIHRQVF